MSNITRSPGLATGYGFIAGGGYQGATSELDALVMSAAEALRNAYGMDVVTRFNSDRRSGSAWLKTHDPDGIWLNAEIGIGGHIIDGKAVVTAHIGREALRAPVANSGGSHPYYHGRHDSIEDALAFVRKNGSLDHIVLP